MNYKEIYNKIIAKAQSQNREKLPIDSQNYVYYENHHIIPRCLGGTNEKDNLVLLTAREHYFCHLLLHKMHPKNPSLCAAVIIIMDHNGLTSSRKYERERIYLAKKMSEYQTGENNTMFGKNAYENKTPEEMKIIGEKISKALKGKKKGKRIKNIETGEYSYCIGDLPQGWEYGTWTYNEETIKNMSEGAKKRCERDGAPKCAFRDKSRNKNPMYNHQHSEEAKKKMSEFRSEFNKGKKWFTNGEKSIFCFETEVPEGFHPGRLYKRK